MMKFTTSRAWERLSLYFNWILMLGISALGFFSLQLLSNPEQLAILGLSSLMTLGAIGTWRWFWLVLAFVRSRIYLHWVFARWRRQANKVPIEELPHLAIIAPTFKEKPWITEQVFRAIALEAKSLNHAVTLVIVTTEPEIVAIGEILKSEDPDGKFVRLISLADPGGGKRLALANGLRALARENLPQNSIVALMDGDSVISPGTFRKCLPFFQMFPKVGALTTDEMPVVVGSYLFSEWLHVRFCQRHVYMCSHSLARKVLCLTGRFSFYRAEAALDPSFADLLENDNLNDWLWGEFKFLSGDDKSTWYWMLRRGYDLLYIPDVMVYTIETISGSFADRAYQNMRRWFGNMLRNGNRAIALGPNRTGWFIWYCLLDQRISIWTALIAPSLLLIYILQANWTAAAIISAWIIFTRPLVLMAFFWGRESHLKPIHLPILLLSQWSSSVIKVWTQMNLAQQKWSNRGNQSRSVGGSAWKLRVKTSTSRFLLVSQVFTYVIVLLCLLQILNPIRDLSELWSRNQVIAKSPTTQTIEGIDQGIVPNDGKDDSVQLQKLINRLPSQGRVQINLPSGEIDLLQPVEINRSNTAIKGQGVGRTILQTRFRKQVGEAAILIRPNRSLASPGKVKNVQLSGFTLLQILPEAANAPDGIVLENVVQAEIKNLDLERSGQRDLIRRQTQNITVEYVSLRDRP